MFRKKPSDPHPLLTYILQQQTVLPFPSADQEAILQIKNSNKNTSEQIPNVLRNYRTGWPLIRLSHLSPVENEKNYYEIPLQKRNDFFYVAAFSLAELIAHIPGKVTILNNDGEMVPDVNVFTIANIQHFSRNYTVSHDELKIGIAQKSASENTPNKTIDLKGQIAEPSLYRALLLEPILFAMNTPGQTLDKNIKYHRHDLEKMVIPGAAIFYDGQIYMDLGVFLQNCNFDRNAVNYFADIFKVHAFKVSYITPNFLPQGVLIIKALEKKYAEQVTALLRVGWEKEIIMALLLRIQAMNEKIVENEKKIIKEQEHDVPSTLHALNKELQQAMLKEIANNHLFDLTHVKMVLETMELINKASEEYETKQGVSGNTLALIAANYQTLSQHSMPKIILGIIGTAVAVLAFASAAAAIVAMSTGAIPVAAMLIALTGLLLVDGMTLLGYGLDMLVHNKVFNNSILSPALSFFKTSREIPVVEEKTNNISPRKIA